MKLKSISLALLFGLWTALTLSGSVWGFIVLNGPNSVSRAHLAPFDDMKLTAMLTVFLCGGGLWGLGIARLMKADAKSMMISCALSWSGTMIALIIAVVLMAAPQGGGFSKINFLPSFPHYRHYNFLLVFVTAVAIITAVNAYVVTSTLGFKELRKSAGMYTGLAAALGFLVTGLILFFGFGLEVGYHIIGKSGMLKMALFCSIGAALVGGMALGWILEKSRTNEIKDGTLATEADAPAAQPPLAPT